MTLLQKGNSPSEHRTLPGNMHDNDQRGHRGDPLSLWGEQCRNQHTKLVALVGKEVCLVLSPDGNEQYEKGWGGGVHFLVPTNRGHK